VWNRGPTGSWDAEPAFVEVAAGSWQPSTSLLPESDGRWSKDDPVFVVVGNAAGERARLYGTVTEVEQGSQSVVWRPMDNAGPPVLLEKGIFTDYRGATLVAKSFDTVHQGLGGWLITIAVC
jgi:AGCS family alanine or glycine:cation symporter